MRVIIMRGFLMALAVTVFVSASALAAVDAAGAREIAKQFVPEGAVYLATKDDINEYEVEFIVSETNSKYEIDVSKNTAKVTKVKFKLKGELGSLSVKLNKDDAAAIALKEFPNATIGHVKLELDKGYHKYEVKFTKGTIRGAIDINAETGTIMEQEIEY